MFFLTQAIAIRSNSNKCLESPQLFFFFSHFQCSYISPHLFPLTKHAMSFLRMNRNTKKGILKKEYRTNDDIKRPLKKNKKNATNQYQKHGE